MLETHRFYLRKTKRKRQASNSGEPQARCSRKLLRGRSREPKSPGWQSRRSWPVKRINSQKQEFQNINKVEALNQEIDEKESKILQDNYVG